MCGGKIRDGKLSYQRTVTMENELKYQVVKSNHPLTEFVESFWLLQNQSDCTREVVVLPDGRVDMFFTRSATGTFHIALLGIQTQPERASIAPLRQTYAISFNPLAVHYLFQTDIAHLVDKGTILPSSFWNFNADDLNDFDLFCEKATKKIHSMLPSEIDERKRTLFNLIYSSKGAITIKELAEKSFWSRQQINRYFSQQFGVTAKAYCNIIRFRASFQHIKEGKLFPQRNFADQSHFIKEVKKLSGVSPKQLFKNRNERFIQFSTLNSE